MYNRLIILQLCFSSKEKWNGKKYTIGKCLDKVGEYLQITNDSEVDAFRWILFYNEYNGKYHITLQDLDGNSDELFEDGIKAMQHWIYLLKCEMYGFANNQKHKRSTK